MLKYDTIQDTNGIIYKIWVVCADARSNGK